MIESKISKYLGEGKFKQDVILDEEELLKKIGYKTVKCCAACYYYHYDLECANIKAFEGVLKKETGEKYRHPDVDRNGVCDYYKKG